MKYLQNTILFVVALALALVICEGGFYILNSNSYAPEIETVDGAPSGERLDFFQYHPVYGFSGLPNVRKKFFGKFITNNSKGFRGPEVDYEAQEGVKRLLFLGDSQTWGWAVGDHETISEFSSRIVNERAVEEEYEVINFGASGYGIDQSYLRLIAEGLRYDPDFVIFTYFADNDIWETASTNAWGVEKPYFYEKDDGTFCLSNVPTKRASGWPADNLKNQFDVERLQFQVAGAGVDLTQTQTFQYFKNRSINRELFGSWGEDDSDTLGALKKHIGCVESDPGPQLSSWQEKIDLALTLLGKIKNVVEKNGGEFIVVTKPVEEDFRNNHLSADYRRVVNELTKQGVRVIDVFEEARREHMIASDLYIAAGHLSPIGNRLVARHVANHVLSYQDMRPTAGLQ